MAADKAMTVYAFDEALGQFERVLGAFDRLGSLQARWPRWTALSCWAGRLTPPTGGAGAQRAVAFARAAIDLTDADADPMGAARCWTRLGRNAWAVGDPPGSAGALAEAERLLPEDEPSVELARVQCEQARWLMLMSHYEQAEVRCRQAISTARAVGGRLEEGHASNTLRGFTMPVGPSR